MNTEQERAEFEAWAKTQSDTWLIVGGLVWSPGTDDYASARTNAAWAAWKAGRAALQSQDREDAERFRFCLEHGFPQKWEEMIKGNFRHYWTSRPGSQEEFSSAIEAIDHARRVEGKGE